MSGGLHEPDQYKDESNLAARQSLLQFIDTIRPTDFFLDLIDWESSDRVLDLGCGNGNFLDIARTRSNLAVGVDLSFGMLSGCRARFDAAANLANVDAVALPFADDAFDAALALWMLYHVPDREPAYEELGRVMRPGGQLLVVTNGARHYEELDRVADVAMQSLTGRPFERLAASASFRVDDAADELVEWFDDVQLLPYRTTMAMSSAEPVVTWFSSIKTELEGQFDGDVTWDQFEVALTAEVDRIIADEGVFRAHGIFVAATATNPS